MGVLIVTAFILSGCVGETKILPLFGIAPQMRHESKRPTAANGISAIGQEIQLPAVLAASPTGVVWPANSDWAAVPR